MKKIIIILILITTTVNAQTTTWWGVNGITANSNHWFGTKNNYALIFKTNNTQKATILANGNFGVGTPNPTEKLEIAGKIKIVDGTEGMGKILTSDATGVGTWITPAVPSNDWKILGNLGTTETTNFIGTTDNVGLSFRTNNTLKATLTNTGNLGLGINNPIIDFHIKKANSGATEIITENTNITASDYADNVILNGDVRTTIGSYKAGSYGFTGTESNHDFYIYANGVTSFVMKPTGRIGIGLTSAVNNPTNTLYIGNTTGSGLSFQSLISTTPPTAGASAIGVDATGKVVRFDSNDTTKWGILGNANTTQETNFLGTTNNVGLSFRTNNVIRATITNTGFVGIGTTTPTAKLEIDNTTSNTSGLKFTRLLSTSPSVSGSPIGVNATGDVVVIPNLLIKTTVNISATPIQAVFGNLLINTGNGVILTSPNNTKFKLSITNSGTLLIEPVL